MSKPKGFLFRCYIQSDYDGKGNNIIGVSNYLVSKKIKNVLNIAGFYLMFYFYND